MLIIDAAREFRAGRAQNELLPEHVDRIFRLYRTFGDVDGVAKVITLDEIAANDYSLNIPRYLSAKDHREAHTVAEAIQQLEESARTAFATEQELIAILKQEGLLA